MGGYEPLVALGAALAAGLLIGLEREQSAPAAEREGEPFLGGARTHALLALVGAGCMLLAPQVGAAPVVVALAALAAFLLVSYADDVRHGRDRGLTSEAAFLVSFVLGALAASQGIIEPLRGRVIAVGGLAVVVAVLLSLKPSLHSVVRKASKEDVFATLKFLVVAVVVLPWLPDQALGPLGVLNPFQIGLMVVLIAGISFAGYLAIRVLGPHRGLGLTGLVGGLVSSTAVTLTFSGRAREEPRLAASCALAVTLASTIMFARVLIEVALVNRALLAIPVGAMLGAGLLASAVIYRSSRLQAAAAPEIQLANPFEFSSAVKFAALFAAVLLASKAATTYLGTGATYLTGLLAGATDVDAITLSMARLAREEGGISAPVAVTTILLGVASNTVVKAVMAGVVGGWAFGRRIALAFGFVIACGMGGLAVVWLA